MREPTGHTMTCPRCEQNIEVHVYCCYDCGVFWCEHWDETDCTWNFNDDQLPPSLQPKNRYSGSNGKHVMSKMYGRCKACHAKAEELGANASELDCPALV